MSGGLPDAVQGAMPAVRILVSGHVQGVGFRAFVREVAEDLEVRGEVWNTRDRRVELRAEHEDASLLQELALRLRNGPGRVEDVLVEPAVESGAKGFGIGYTR